MRLGLCDGEDVILTHADMICSVTVKILFFFFMLIRDFAFKNASIGKKIFRLKVVKIDGTKLTIGDIIKRNLFMIFLTPIEVFSLLINYRRLGDILAKTIVVSSDSSEQTEV